MNTENIEAPKHSDPLSEFVCTLTIDERRVLKGKLSKTIPLYFDNNNNLSFSEKFSEKNFNHLAATLRAISPNCRSIPRNGVIFRGFPDWLKGNTLLNLQRESETRRLEPLDRIDHYLGCGGRYADQLSVDESLIKFVEQKVREKIKATGVASYLYYDKPGLGIKPHVDTDVFSINMMLMLKHDCKDNESRSATLIFPESSATESHRLDIGEVMLMYGGAVIHSRSIIIEDENVCLLTIGFNICDKEISS